ncbi:MAG: SPFH domain-containing protein [Alphaproteobacteria bacterium]|nr:SPFH domain-containing protein [Alphaproteobacteria bacterium]
MLEVISFNDPSSAAMVARVPEEGMGDYRTGTQIVVQEGQTAIFFRDGQALDEFAPGRHTLTTGNMPLLGQFLGKGFETSPFKSHVYFVSTRIFNDVGWGTKTPINFADKVFGIVPIRGFGMMSIRIVNARLFLQTLIGTLGRQYTDDIVNYLRGILVGRLTDLIAKGFTSIVDLPGRYSELSAQLAQALRPQLAQFGVDLIEVNIGAITPPPSVQQMIERAAGIRIQDIEAYRGVAAADALRDAASKTGAGNAAGEGVSTGIGIAMGVAAAREMLGTASPARSGPASGTDSIEDRLRRAKRLADEGLMTAEEYVAARKEILDDL